jgi:hypothetical protein
LLLPTPPLVLGVAPSANTSRIMLPRMLLRLRLSRGLWPAPLLLLLLLLLLSPSPSRLALR